MKLLLNILQLNRGSSFIIVALLLFGQNSKANTEVIIDSASNYQIQLVGYSDLTEYPLYEGSSASGEEKTLKLMPSYQGLALLSFSGGQKYPIIIGNHPITVHISSPQTPPTFIHSDENIFFYNALSSKSTVSKSTTYPFAQLMLQAKKLLKSSYTIKTPSELSDKKTEIESFVSGNYSLLRHSDMVRRLIDQYFMMHEYVNYHQEGAPASDIRKKYINEVVAGVGRWVDTLQPHIANHEILNYCVSLYYKRSMVSLASIIMNRHKKIAFCPGETLSETHFSDDLSVLNHATNRSIPLKEITQQKYITTVSLKCPVSLVQAVSKARQFASRKDNIVVIAAPVEELSEEHLAMNRLLSQGQILFINDSEWSNSVDTQKVRLPQAILID